MRPLIKRPSRWVLGWGLAGLALVCWPGLAMAQISGRTAGGGFSGSSFSGGGFSGGSFSGGSFSGGGFSGGSFSGGSFSGGGFSGGGFSGGSFSGGSFSGGGFSGGSFSGGSFSGGGFSGGSFSGGGFSGGSFSGGGFSGGNYSGGGSFSGGGGGFSGGGFSGGSGANSYQGVSPTNAFNSYFVNPMAYGVPSTSTAQMQIPVANPATRFGYPLYGNTTTTNATTNYGNASTSNTNLSGFGAVSAGGKKAVEYTTGGELTTPPAPTSPGPRPPAATAARPRPDLQQIIDRSSLLPSKNGIQVVEEGGVVVLRGKVASDYERRQAELLLRFDPTVKAVRNDLEVP